MQAFDAAEATVSALLPAAEGHVRLHRLARAVDVDLSGLKLGCHAVGAAQVLGVDIGAKAVVGALRDGIEDAYPGDVAQEWLARWRDNPKALERELSA